jgi:hypothetical protein
MQDPKNSLKTVSDLWFISISSRIGLQSRLTTHQTAYAKLRPRDGALRASKMSWS